MTTQKRPKGPVDVFRCDVRRPYICNTMYKNPQMFTELDANRRLCTAVADGNTDQLESLLVESKLDPNAKNHHDDTAAHQACMDGRVVELSMLLRHGLDINSTNVDGDTPMHVASRYGRAEIVECLANALPDETVRNNKWMTPLDEAMAAKEAQCVGQILRYINYGKARAKEDYCSAERRRLEKFRRVQEVLYGRDMKDILHSNEPKQTSPSTMTAHDKANVTTLLQATLVASRCIAAGVHAAVSCRERESVHYKTPATISTSGGLDSGSRGPDISTAGASRAATTNPSNKCKKARFHLSIPSSPKSPVPKPHSTCASAGNDACPSLAHQP